ncbi:hypothetical protein [Leptospira ainazelensis]|uniref:hypothetical protein n=1 Tax=Leptospira ainazelensis TaxID=2810034 RepID=UPI001962A02A|nr:hypothetical protein [Leptospira ainazelensis]
MKRRRSYFSLFSKIKEESDFFEELRPLLVDPDFFFFAGVPAFVLISKEEPGPVEVP